MEPCGALSFFFSQGTSYDPGNTALRFRSALPDNTSAHAGMWAGWADRLTVSAFLPRMHPAGTGLSGSMMELRIPLGSCSSLYGGSFFSSAHHTVLYPYAAFEHKSPMFTCSVFMNLMCSQQISPKADIVIYTELETDKTAFLTAARYTQKSFVPVDGDTVRNTQQLSLRYQFRPLSWLYLGAKERLYTKEIPSWQSLYYAYTNRITGYFQMKYRMTKYRWSLYGDMEHFIAPAEESEYVAVTIQPGIKNPAVSLNWSAQAVRTLSPPEKKIELNNRVEAGLQHKLGRIAATLKVTGIWNKDGEPSFRLSFGMAMRNKTRLVFKGSIGLSSQSDGYPFSCKGTLYY
ncbi:MAG: hypothetical protein JXB03_08715 [Spirochaetales bacterium]|nr:hypothetical protein [Spirochaetales bacterium]